MTKTRYYLLHLPRHFILSSYKNIAQTNFLLSLQVIYVILFIFIYHFQYLPLTIC
ncbi:MAG: hypothetical protein JWQ85_1344 [Mucilaginibacter sp.]|jgi:hypothetical protein|nr:hypothetical protein [Mucilaginibacter sp.]